MGTLNDRPITITLELTRDEAQTLFNAILSVPIQGTIQSLPKPLSELASIAQQLERLLKEPTS